jgi:predicted membrane-bound mannosyltransferase
MPPRRKQEAATAATPKSEAVDAAPTVSLEAVLWGVLLVGAFALRLARLDALPLTLEESYRAFAAFSVSEGSVPEGWTGDPASALTALLFAIFGESDTLARIVPALAGGALVGAFWLAGRYVGRGAALAAATLIALSPLAILASRSALPFSLGALLSLAIVLSLFAYLRDPRLPFLSTFVACLALAPTVDAVATATAIAVIAFLLIEGALRGEEHISRAFSTFRDNPAQQGVAGVIVVVALALGLSHFGTSLGRLGLAGLTQWGDMFASPTDGRAGAYVKFLVGYDWPLLLAGGLGLLVGARRLLGGGKTVSLFQRFVLFWAAIALVMTVLTTRRESGQLLILLLPLALLAGSLLEEIVTSLDWSALQRAWLPLVAALLLAAYAFLVLTQWSQGRADGSEKAYMVLALILAAGLIVAVFPALGRDAATVAVTAIAALAAVFLVHSSLSAVLADGSEFALGPRSDENVESFADTVAQIGPEGDRLIVIDPNLRQPLEWYLRDERIAFADPSTEAAVYVAPASATPAGFAAQGERRRLTEGWYPTERSILKSWRWLLYRTPFGNLSSTDAAIFLPAP